MPLLSSPPLSHGDDCLPLAACLWINGNAKLGAGVDTRQQYGCPRASLTSDTDTVWIWQGTIVNETDFTLCSLPMLYSRNKNRTYHERITRSLTALLTFMKANELFAKDPFNEDGSLNKAFELKQSEVTPEGVEMFRKIVPGWFTYLDKGGTVDNLSRLEKGLEKIRNPA